MFKSPMIGYQLTKREEILPTTHGLTSSIYLLTISKLVGTPGQPLKRVQRLPITRGVSLLRLFISLYPPTPADARGSA